MVVGGVPAQTNSWPKMIHCNLQRRESMSYQYFLLALISILAMVALTGGFLALAAS
jgi:hypothetical protein